MRRCTLNLIRWDGIGRGRILPATNPNELPLPVLALA